MGVCRDILITATTTATVYLALGQRFVSCRLILTVSRIKILLLNRMSMILMMKSGSLRLL
jgi:hypothetical protein